MATVEVGEVALELVPVPEGSTAIVHAANNYYKPESDYSGKVFCSCHMNIHYNKHESINIMFIRFGPTLISVSPLNELADELFLY